MEKQKGSKRIEKVINYKKIFLEDFQAGSTRKSYEKSNLINSTFLSNKKVGEKIPQNVLLLLLLWKDFL